MKNGTETEIGVVADAGNHPDLLTEAGLVRITVQKAPRVGFEPTTSRLTVDCSTTELPGNSGSLTLFGIYRGQLVPLQEESFNTTYLEYTLGVKPCD